MKKVLSLCLVLALMLTFGISASAADAETVTVFCDGSAAYKMEPEMRDADFDGEFFFARYFGDDIKAGMQTLVEAGGVTANGFPVAGEHAMDDLAQDLKAAGTQVTLTLEDGKVTHMDVFTTAGALIDHVEEKDGVIVAYVSADEPFMVEKGFGPNAVREDVSFAPENVKNITEGCIAVYWEAPDGWHLEGAEAVKGYLTDGADHQFYVLEDKDGNKMEYVDAAMYSRSFSEGNRPGQFTNTHMNFGLNEFEITVWFIPGTVGTDNPMPIGITSLENAKARLEAAMAYTQAVLERTVVAPDAEAAKAAAQEQGLGDDFHWVTEDVTVDHVSAITGKASAGVLDMLSAKLAETQALLDSDAASAAMDQAAYELFIAMWGSSSDIGAVFMGTAEEGFFDVADAGINALPAAVLK